MIDWKFLLYSETGEIVPQEPEGFTEIVFEIRRDRELHGVLFENSLNEIKFYGKAADFIEERYNEKLIETEIYFEASYRCDIEAEYEVALMCKLDFGRYEKQCGTECSIKVGLQNAGCVNTFRSRKETKVDLDATECFDKITPLPNYGFGINGTVDLPAIGVYAENNSVNEQSESNNTEDVRQSFDWFANGTPNTMRAYVFPPMQKTISASLGIFNPSPIWELRNGGFNNRPDENFTAITEITNAENLNISCDSGLSRLECGMNFTVQQIESGGSPTPITFLTAKIFTIEAGLDPTDATNYVQIDSVALATLTGNENSGVINYSFSGDVSLLFGMKIYFGIYISVNTENNIDNFIFTALPENYFKLTSIINCEPSQAKISLIYEAMDKVVQSTTDGCMRLKSAYYGRKDSLPISYDSDGCGSLRMLTNGLRLRKAETDKHFVSFQDFVSGLNPIDNIGVGIEKDPFISSRDVVVVEEMRYFYDDSAPIIVLKNIPNVVETIMLDRFLQNIKIGYEKWESEDLLGLIEPNSNREYRTTLKTATGSLTQLSKFIAASYAIELTRRQSFAITGKADQKYDNENFIICGERAFGYGYPAYGYAYYGEPYDIIVETGNYFSTELGVLNLFNIRITPIRNLLRWFKSIANSYVNIFSTTSKINFVSGTGNYDAITEHTIDGCIVEAPGDLKENENVSIITFDNYDLPEYADNFKPVTKNELVRFEYPLSIKEYNLLKANPYRLIGYICGNASQKNGFISSIKYSPVEGIAQFELIKNYE